MSEKIYDLLIVGAGPAGTAAAVYAARKQLKTAMVFFEWGGQSTVSSDIQNWIGYPHISGQDLAVKFKEHVEEYKSSFVDIYDFDKVTKITKLGENFLINTEAGKEISARSVLITVGSTRRKLDVPGADVFEHKGVTYCASCDGPFFAGQEVIVVGGGNAAFESAAQLLAYCPKVTLVQRGSEFRADPVTVEKLSANSNFRSIRDVEIVRVDGGNTVSGLTITHKRTGEVETISAAAIFVEIGLIPSTDFLAGVMERNASGQIIIDPRTQRTSTVGIWAAGDCTDILYHQNNIAAGDAVRALEDIYLALKAA